MGPASVRGSDRRRAGKPTAARPSRRSRVPPGIDPPRLHGDDRAPLQRRKCMSIRTVVISGFVVLGSILALALLSATPPRNRVDLQVFAPKSGDIAGIGGRAFLVDLVARFRGDLASTGASPELTGPGPHANTNPFP